MKFFTWLGTLSALALSAALAGCATPNTGATRLVDAGSGLKNFKRIGEANWAEFEGALQATSGGTTPAYLVTPTSYKDFVVKAEFWSSDDANSGIFMRCQNPAAISDESCYEVNIFDQRPDQTYATASIVKVAPIAQPAPKAGGKWNTFEITMRGDRLMVVFNGVKTIDVRDAKFASGPLALQWGRGTIRFRSVEIRPI